MADVFGTSEGSGEANDGLAPLPSPVSKTKTEGVRNSVNFRNFMPEHINKEITRRYNIDKCEIGAGGYGKVYIAKDRHFEDRLVAIKKVVKHDAQKTAAFRCEIKIMKELDHPNICKLLETYEQGRFMFFVMEFCEGGEVFDRIMETGLIAEDITADIIRQVSTALKYAHSRGIAHRDMKPENIVFCNSDVTNSHVKVIDWGLGFYFGQTRMKSAVGSLTYAAPEVLEAKETEEYSSACDLWSLGIVAYVMLCGKPPFWGSHNEQLKSMKQERYPITGEPWTSISAHAKDFIKRLLKKRPDQRMSIDKVLMHPWLTSKNNMGPAATKAVAQNVLSNLKNFSQTSQFFSICVTSVARQLDHRHLRDIHLVFREMDTNGDGTLDIEEVKEGFKKIYGMNSSQELTDIEAMFNKLDIDGSGAIDYTEFCAAGIGEKVSCQEYVLWAAFKTFDVQDDNGQISKDEIMQVLGNKDVEKAWSKDVCSDVAQEIMDMCDGDGNGEIDFEEWMTMMRTASAKNGIEADEREPEIGTQEHELVEALQDAEVTGKTGKAYDILLDLNKVGAKGDGAPQPVVVKKPTGPRGPSTGRAQEVSMTKPKQSIIVAYGSGLPPDGTGSDVVDARAGTLTHALCAESPPCVLL